MIFDSKREGNSICFKLLCAYWLYIPLAAFFCSFVRELSTKTGERASVPSKYVVVKERPLPPLVAAPTRSTVGAAILLEHISVN